MRLRRDQQYSGVVFSTPGVQTTSEGCLVGQWGVGACVLRPVCSSGGGGRGGGGGGSGLGGSGWARGERTGSSQCVRASWNRSLLKWQMIWTSRQEMRGPQPPFRCSAQHYVRTASWCSKAGHVRSWRCLPPRRASMAMPRSTWSVLTSLLARNTKISARPLIIWMSPTSKGMTSS
ncbi:eukaryotic translation initiation factor 5A-1 isoform X1 [Mustela erminea]|uniref:eukaryotic translation initiation factor 5A-1 isoform X1 n=1 Tax=Mustela erminea TaxID=36723 RepID=UPI001386A852|nr:eukaryotic translation initiation factor 5A-1 isoform X1 [Mustela erminea]